MIVDGDGLVRPKVGVFRQLEHLAALPEEAPRFERARLAGHLLRVVDRYCLAPRRVRQSGEPGALTIPPEERAVRAPIRADHNVLIVDIAHPPKVADPPEIDDLPVPPEGAVPVPALGLGRAGHVSQVV